MLVLEDVDLVIARQKRYSFADPLLRLWVRLHCRPVPPAPEELEALRADVRTSLDSIRQGFAPPPTTRLIGVAGTVTQLAALKAGIPVYDPDVTHHAVLSHGDVRPEERGRIPLSFSVVGRRG